MVTDSDRDMIVRTVIGEAGNQSDAGKAAVAHSILNRVNAGGYGNTATDVVLARHQYEPWQAHARELTAIDPNSAQYKKTAAIVDDVVSGKIEDSTGGATHFLSPSIMQARGKPLPSWARGQGTPIGDHVFFSPYKTAQAGGGDDEVLRHFAAPSGGAPQTAAADQDDVLRHFAAPVGTAVGQPAPVAAPPPAAPAATPNASPLSTGQQLQNQVVEGMPIIGPLMNKAVAATGAAIQPYLAKPRNLTDLITGKSSDAGGTFWDRYQKNLSDINSQSQEFASQHPVASTAANLTGAGMALGPLAGTRIGGAALGVAGPTLGARALTGAVGGAALNATDAVVRGQDPGAAAVVGGAGGLIAPAAGSALERLIAGGGKYLRGITGGMGELSNVPRRGIDLLTNAMGEETLPSFNAGLQRMGPRGTLADLNQGMTDIAGGISDLGGASAQHIRGAYQNRLDTQRGAIESALTQAMGPRVNVVERAAQIATDQKAAANPLYTQWRSMQVPKTAELDALVPRLDRAGAFDLAKELHGIRTGQDLNIAQFKSGEVSPEMWDLAKRGLDRKIDTAFRAGDKTLGSELVGLKNNLIDEIRKTPAGQVWDKARSAFAHPQDIQEQLAAGRDTFLGGRSGMSRDELAAELKGLSDAEINARVQGARSAVSDAMGDTLRGDSTLRNKLLAENNREKLKLLLGARDPGGAQKADQLVRTLEQEKFGADQASAIIPNMNTGASAEARKRRAELFAQPQLPGYLDTLNITQPASWVPASLWPQHVIGSYRAENAARAAPALAPIMTRRGNDMFRVLEDILRERNRTAATQHFAQPAGSALTGLITGPGAAAYRQMYERDQATRPPQLRDLISPAH